METDADVVLETVSLNSVVVGWKASISFYWPAFIDNTSGRDSIIYFSDSGCYHSGRNNQTRGLLVRCTGVLLLINQRNFLRRV